MKTFKEACDEGHTRQDGESTLLIIDERQYGQMLADALEEAARIVHKRVDECIKGFHDAKSTAIKKTHQDELNMSMCCEADILALVETVRKEGK